MRLYLSHKVHPTEDCLTGMLVDILDWWPSSDLLRDVLARARTFENARLASRAAFPVWNSFRVVAWPQWPVGEPDVVLDLLADDVRVATVVLEAKLGAAKSGEDVDDDETFDPEAGDQLARYYGHAVKTRGDAHVVYLTHHVLPPLAELSDSYDAMVKRGSPATGRLHWLSWRDVELVVRSAGAVVTHPLSRCAISVAAVLEDLGFRPFEARWWPTGFAALSEPVRWRTRASARRHYRWALGTTLGDPTPFYRSVRRGPDTRRWRVSSDTLPQPPPMMFYRRR